jgi:DNA-binding response OmpR family regulator
MHRKPRLLYMEDERVTARLVQRRLEAQGFAVDVARDGTEGLARCAQIDYELVLVDKNMPGPDGLEVIRALAATGGPASIMVTGTGDELSAVEALKSGASDYIVKDSDGRYLELVPAVVQQVLEQRAIADAKRRAEEEKERLIVELRRALANVKTLSGLLPICANCKKIRNDDGYWTMVETYLSEHSEAEFSHGICPDCGKDLYGDLYVDEGS